MNPQRALVDRDARRATRLHGGGGQGALAALKRRARKAFRGQVRRACLAVRNGNLDADATDWQPEHLATGWDVA